MGPSYWTSDEVHVCGLDVVHEHREVIERRAQQVEQAVHEDVDAHLVRVRVRIRARARARVRARARARVRVRVRARARARVRARARARERDRVRVSGQGQWSVFRVSGQGHG